MTDEPVFAFAVSADYNLTKHEIWPNGGAPENPCAEDVRDYIRLMYGSDIVSFMSEWNFTTDLDVDVNGVPVFGPLAPGGKVGE